MLERVYGTVRVEDAASEEREGQGVFRVTSRKERVYTGLSLCWRECLVK